MHDAEVKHLEMLCKYYRYERISIHRYGEVCKPGYSFSGTSAGAAGHFTQVVWKGTVSLGIGMATAKSKSGLLCTYIVGRYRPPGNFIGDYKENVPKGEFSKDTCVKLDEMVKNITKGISHHLCSLFSSDSFDLDLF